MIFFSAVVKEERFHTSEQYPHEDALLLMAESSIHWYANTRGTDIRLQNTETQKPKIHLADKAIRP